MRGKSYLTAENLQGVGSPLVLGVGVSHDCGRLGQTVGEDLEILALEVHVLPLAGDIGIGSVDGVGKVLQRSRHVSQVMDYPE